MLKAVEDKKIPFPSILINNAGVYYKDIFINAVCPGWVRTDIGGKNAIRSVKEGAKGIVDAALMEKGFPSGVLLRDG